MTPERLQRLRSVLDRRQPDLTVVTDHVHKGRNLSAILRTADAAGVTDLHCVLSAKEYRAFRGTAMGSNNWVNTVHHESLREVLGSLKASGHQIVAAHLGDATKELGDIDFTKPTAILLGAEKFGVSDVGTELADVFVSLPMQGMVQSLNVSVASGVILHEVVRQRTAAGLYDARRLDDERWQRLFFEWGHPKLRDFCRERNLPYPPLGDDGELEDGPAWYASVNESALKSRQSTENICIG